MKGLLCFLHMLKRAIWPAPGKCQVCGCEVEPDKTWCVQCADETIW